MEFAARAFSREDVQNGEVFVFARRQDCDDFAGLEVIARKVTDRVILFHPVFSAHEQSAPSLRSWNIVTEVFDDVFDFVAARVVPDMKDRAQTDDASDL